MIMEKSGLLMDVIGVLFLLPFHNQILWASARVPAGSVPSTQSQKKRGGDYRAMASCQGVLNEG